MTTNIAKQELNKRISRRTKLFDRAALDALTREDGAHVYKDGSAIVAKGGTYEAVPNYKPEAKEAPKGFVEKVKAKAAKKK